MIPTFNFYCRWDADAKVFVGFIEGIGIYTQAQTKARLNHAGKSAVETFVRICHERGILGRVMAERKQRKPPEGYALVAKFAMPILDCYN